MKFAVIGDPVSHSLSPAMHQAAYEALDLDYSYEAIRVPVGEVCLSLDRLLAAGYQGVNVTVPHKEEALAWCSCDELSVRARAVNTIDLVQRSGINTDGPGFVEVLRDAGLASGRVLLLGAGGSSRALAFELVAAGYELTIWNRTHERAEALATEVGAAWSSQASVDGFDAVVNGTSASLQGVDLPLVFSAPRTSERMAPLAVDLYYTKKSTPFLKVMAQQGFRTLDGRSLLVAQGALAFEFWTGATAPRSAMKRAVGL